MGNKLFGRRGIDIAKTINNELGGDVLQGTLIKLVPGTRTTGSLAAGTNPTSRNFTFNGFVESFTLEERTGTTIQKGDRKVMIFGDSLPVGVIPQPQDQIEIEGSTGNLQEVLERDPDAATYICQVR